MSGKVAIIGGGPAGIMAAGRAAQCGAQSVLLERGPKLARKLRISGKGRCNITNVADIEGFIDAFYPNGKFLYGAFSRFFRDDLIEILQSEGVETKVERGGRVFPVSDKAADVADAIERWMIRAGAQVRLNARARSVMVQDGRVVGVEMYGGRLDADAVVIATGGISYPRTGSTGDGYAMARAVGHTVVNPRPALSPLICEEEWVKELQGLSLRNVRATLLLYVPGSDRPKKIASEFGEMLFTHFGVSGPIVLTLSREVAKLVEQAPNERGEFEIRSDQAQQVFISIDLKPALSREQLHARLVRDFKQTKHLKNYLRELLPRLLINVFLALVGIDPDKPANTITVEERTRMVELLKDLRLVVKGMTPLEQAIVTAGGVSIKEIDPRTMMSKLVKGLFFAGEVIDIDARTGGFNLQAAFSTGWVAGEAAAKYAADYHSE